MPFISFSSTPVEMTPSQTWAVAMQQRALQTIADFFQSVRATYLSVWAGKDINPQGPVDRISALGTGAHSAFAAHATAVNYLLTTLPLFDGTQSMLAEAATWQVPDGWTISFNDDGSANVTPPIGQ